MSDPVAAPTPEAVVPTTQGIILYTDGGCRPNPGFGGWGMHGYMYSKEAPVKKIPGNPDYVPTGNGYISKSDANLQMGAAGAEERRAYDRNIEVTPIHYIDGYGSFGHAISNNVAELEATINGLRYSANYDINDVQIYTDSEYVRKGLESWCDMWAKNNWLKQDLTPPANVETWKELVATRDVLSSRGVNVKINWVRSHTDKNSDHADILGNILADKLATVGVMASRGGRVINSIDSTTAEGYWKYSVDRHPMLANRRMYFNTMKEYLRPGEYYLGDHGKEDDLLGKRISDGAYCVIQLAAPDPVLETLRNHQSVLAGGTDTIMMVRLDHLYRPDTHKEIMTYGALAMTQSSPYRMDLECLDKQPLTREFRPPRLAMRAVEAVSDLAEKLASFLGGNTTIIVTDLTAILYETTAKIGKKAETITSMKLKAEYVVGYSALAVEANYVAPEGVVKAVPVTLTLGLDLLDRNALKRLEDTHPKVSLITWLEAPNVFRYATVIQSGDDKGIWAGVYSNLRVVTPT